MADSDLVKVVFKAPGGDIETMWTTPLGGGRYRLENFPFFMYGLSYHDVVYARRGRDGRPVFRRIVQKSGNRTVRVAFDEGFFDSAEGERFRNRVEEYGSSFEGATKRFIAISIPPEVEIEILSEWLEREGFHWEYADPTYEALFGRDTDAGDVAATEKTARKSSRGSKRAKSPDGGRSRS